MPPGFDASSPENASLISSFIALGLPSNSATELVRQPKAGAAFETLVDEHHLHTVKLDEKQAGALVKLSAIGEKLGTEEKHYVVGKVVKGDLRSPDQVTGALYLDCLRSRIAQ